MNFENSFQIRFPHQSLLFNSVSIVSNFPWRSEKNIVDIEIAINLIEMEMAEQKIDISKLGRLNLYLFRNSSLILTLNDPGNQLQFSSINFDFLDNIQYQCIRVAIVIEELVHFYWNITDEYKIKHIVIYILRKRWPNIEVEDIFKLDTIQDHQKEQELILSPYAFDNKLRY